MRRLLVLGLLLALTAAVCADGVRPVGQPRWESAGPGLEVLRSTWQSATGGHIELLAVRADLNRYRLRVLAAGPDLKRTWRADEMLRRTKATVAVNGPFFDTDGRAMGLVIADGRALQSMPRPSSANGSVLSVQDKVVRIQAREDFMAAGITQAVQCAPRLVAAGHATDKLLDADQPATRIVVALTADHRIIFVCVPRWSTGATLHDLQAILQHPLFRAVDAMCMDGGASTQMSIQSGSVHEDLRARDPVPVGLGLFLR